MQRNGKKSRKIRKLIIASTLSAVVLIVSTYTWFIGMRTVNVNPFEINIASTEGLFLSMDGNTWTYQLDVNDATAYSGNTNSWTTEGLIPVSSVGDFDVDSSRMKLYELGSYTTTAGGYRLLASQVANTAADGKEADGYIAFDLFIKNLSGDAYYADLDTKNEEAIYLTTDSVVVESSTGASGAINTGIANAIRVGFMQIGRVTATTTDVSKITGIKCTTAAGTKTDSVTSICRDAQIWEPNETNHIAGALAWYNKSCAKRTAGNIYDDNSYTTTASCAAIDGRVETYAVTRELTVTDHVDIYDGLNHFTTMPYIDTDDDGVKDEGEPENVKVINDYTTYKAADANGKAKMTLVNYDYFTDEEKNKVGTDRPTFMTLAPNSITKVRVYVWLEGQDIDNYNFSQLGKQITINFGFTKERFRAEENSTVPPYTYDGPNFETSDPNYVEYTTVANNS